VRKRGGELVGQTGRAPYRRGDRRRPHAGTRRGGALQRRATRRLPELRLPRRRRHREHVPVLGRLQRPLLRQPQRRVLALAESRAADARPVDGGEQGSHRSAERASQRTQRPMPHAWGKGYSIYSTVYPRTPTPRIVARPITTIIGSKQLSVGR
jgi:hypothetical protein